MLAYASTPDHRHQPAEPNVAVLAKTRTLAARALEAARVKRPPVHAFRTEGMRQLKKWALIHPPTYLVFTDVLVSHGSLPRGGVHTRFPRTFLRRA